MPTCKGCGAYIEWAETKFGKKIPIEKQVGGNIVLQDRIDDQDPLAIVVPRLQGTHVSHFANCPAADRFRSKR